MTTNAAKLPDGNIILSDALKLNYYPSLNGLRAISIVIVVMSHFNLYHTTLSAMIFNGGLGVNIFFVISGFLITTLCLKERQSTGTISLKNFYIRRVLRIFPVAYLYLAVILILNFMFHLDVAWFQFIGVFFYIMNFNYFKLHQFSWYTGHFWSLANEEQFYLIFPFLLRKNFRLFTWTNMFIVLVLPILCFVQCYVPALNQGIYYGFTHYLIKFQSISVGCLFSVFAFKKGFDHKWLRSYKITGNIIAFFLLFYLQFDEFYSIHAVFINLLVAVLAGYIIISNVLPAKDFIFRFLNLKAVSFVGVLSYSIYIWQQLFISYTPKLPWFMVTLPYNIAFIVVVPILSYFFYEKYFLKLKTRFTRLKGKNATENLVY